MLDITPQFFVKLYKKRDFYMDFTIKSQLSALILTALMERDMYGLEIIQDVLIRSNGDVSIKQPSLYSNLKRMEANGYITSYWQVSDIGGNRHYYSITDLGRKLYNEMQLEIFAAQRRMRRVMDPETTGKPVPPVLAAIEEITELKDIKEKQTELKESHPGNPTVLEQQSLFAFNNPQEPTTIKAENHNKKTSDSPQYDMFNTKPEQDPSKNDAVLYDKEGRILNKAIRMSLDEPVEFLPSEAKTVVVVKEIETIAEKPMVEEVVVNEPPAPIVAEPVILEPIYPKEVLKRNNDDAVLITERKEKTTEEDQGVFITLRPGSNDLPRVKRIDPANLDIYAKTTGRNMPEPVKETMYNPTDRKGNYSQLIGSLYNRSANHEQKEEIFTSYKQLSSYYAEKGIWFQEYSKTAKERKYQTNKIHFLRSLLVFVLTCLLTGGSYWLFSALGYTKEATNFIYIIPPCFAMLFVLYCGYQWLQTQSRPPKKPWSMYLAAGLWILAIAITLIIHIFSYATSSFSDMMIRASTLLFPSIICIMIPVNTLIADMLYKKLKF